MNHSNFEYADFKGAKLSGLFAKDTIFDNAGLKHTGFSHATFENARLAETDFDDAVISSSCFNNAKMHRTELKRTTLIDNQFEGAEIIDVSFRGATLKNNVFRKARLNQLILEDTKIEGADFSAAYISGVENELIDLGKPEWTGLSTFDYAGLRQVDLRHAPPTIIAAALKGFGDTTVKLPAGVAPPGHWAVNALKESDFLLCWRGWLEDEEPKHDPAQSKFDIPGFLKGLDLTSLNPPECARTAGVTDARAQAASRTGTGAD